MSKKADDIHLKNIRSMNRIKNYIDKLPVTLRGPATEVAAQHFVQRLRLYPPYAYVTRKRAYGNRASGVTGVKADKAGFFSAKQRRWFFWALKSGRMNPGYPQRTGNMLGREGSDRGWQLERKGVKVGIVNKEPGINWTMGPGQQARLNRLAGWEEADKVIRHKDVTDGAIKAMAIFVQADIDEKLSNK